MANTDLMIMTDKKFETSSKALNKELNAILDAMKKGVKAGESIAQHLLAIRTAELWKNKDGEFIVVEGVECKTFGDVATVFNMSKQQAYKLASAYQWKYEEEALTERLTNFTLGQITEMLRLSVSDAIVLLDEGLITNTMTLKAIRDAVDSYKEEYEEPSTSDAEDSGSDVEVGDDLPEEDNSTLTIYLGKNELVLSDKDYNDFVKWLTKREYI